ncbi:predicted protein [Nematostella vectensis]|uniref:EF-hand domain-containing protein n=1 Tax=Nematostella vectensis TaxID=45351 RepID=A7RZI2_NEMVE|nr:predicted protein [Nematostella vectensis]|eukprot:XP_001635161.1 predicted protein [Nematostella vectensis]
MDSKLSLLSLLVVLVLVTLCYAPPVKRGKPAEKAPEPNKDDPEYARYLRQVIEILEKDEDYVRKLMNASDDDLRSGRIAEDIDLVKHDVRSKLDELKRQEVERQRMIRRQMNDHLNGIKEREYWNPLFDDENPDFFGADDFKKLLWKHHEEMDKQDRERREEFKKHEMQKEHERKIKMKDMDEKHRKEAEEHFRELQEKHHNQSKQLHHPGSKAQLEQVWEESDGLDAKDFDPKTFFKLHDVNGDGFLDTGELEALFVKEVTKLYNPKDEDYDPKERDEEISRMREHVMNEIDKDKDGFVSQDEFLQSSKGEEFDKDDGWKSVEDERPYTDEELAEFEKSLEQDQHPSEQQQRHDQQQQHHDQQQQQHHDQQQQHHEQQKPQ